MIRGIRGCSTYCAIASRMNRLVYVVDGRRVVGYDNERSKGDHRHLGEREERYCFIDPDTLLADFWRDVKGAAA